MSFISAHVLHSYCLTLHTILVLENIIMVSNFSMGALPAVMADGSIEFFFKSVRYLYS